MTSSFGWGAARLCHGVRDEARSPPRAGVAIDYRAPLPRIPVFIGHAEPFSGVPPAQRRLFTFDQGSGGHRNSTLVRPEDPRSVAHLHTLQARRPARVHSMCRPPLIEMFAPVM